MSLTFDSFSLIDPIREAIARKGYTHPTPVQAQSIPPALEGRDLFALAQTGTGKTAAFAIPVLQRLAQTASPANKSIRALILAPTRELALQIDEALRVYGKNLDQRIALIYGGVSQSRQEDALRNKPSIVIATPGRLLDLCAQRHADLRNVEILVLDECDRMLDMGFARDLNKIISMLPPKRQTMLLSATMPAEIRTLAANYLKSPAMVEIVSESTSPKLIRQELYRVDGSKKMQLLSDLLKDDALEQVLVFTRTKRGADRLAKNLAKNGVTSAAIHGDKSQNQREQSLDRFRKGKMRVLVATDVASRGIDVKELTHVINYDMPGDVETYIHRIGRTGRAGKEGVSITFSGEADSAEERDLLRVHGEHLRVISDHPYPHDPLADRTPPKKQQRPPRAKTAPGVPAPARKPDNRHRKPSTPSKRPARG
jgi:ATP-dependent RNA helicase RhlE